MGATKTEAFSLHQNRVAALAKALGHPARVAIVEYLLSHPGCITNDLVNELPLAQSTVSRHLQELRAVGWLIGTVEGPSVCYCLNPDAIHEFNAIAQTFGTLTVATCRC